MKKIYTGKNAHREELYIKEDSILGKRALEQNLKILPGKRLHVKQDCRFSHALPVARVWVFLAHAHP